MMKGKQFGSRHGRGTVDTIFIVRKVIEKAKEKNVPLHFNFFDFKASVRKLFVFLQAQNILQIFTQKASTDRQMSIIESFL